MPLCFNVNLMLQADFNKQKIPAYSIPRKSKTHMVYDTEGVIQQPNINYDVLFAFPWHVADDVILYGI